VLYLLIDDYTGRVASRICRCGEDAQMTANLRQLDTDRLENARLITCNAASPSSARALIE
jgi:hypothetical protein